MENKAKKISINTVIYLLLAAMLVAVIAISVFTVSSRRRGETPNTDDSVSDTTLGNETTQPSESGRAPQSTAKPNDTTSPEGTAASDSKTSPTSKDTEEDVPVGTELRYFVVPVVGSVSKSFEIDIPVYSLTMNDYRAHTGVDIAAALGSEVVSASSGTVCKIWNDPLM